VKESGAARRADAQRGVEVPGDDLAAEGSALEHVEAAEHVGGTVELGQRFAPRQQRWRGDAEREEIGHEERGLALGPRPRSFEGVLRPQPILDRRIEPVKLLDAKAVGDERQGSLHEVELELDGVVLGARLRPESLVDVERRLHRSAWRCLRRHGFFHRKSHTYYRPVLRAARLGKCPSGFFPLTSLQMGRAPMPLGTPCPTK